MSFFRAIAIVGILVFGALAYWAATLKQAEPVFYAVPRAAYWEFQSIDTMKYSRDMAREKAEDAAFDEVIETQVRNIAEAGATHVAIATPYDEEFLPFLKRWVAAARQHHLKVWFRGNFAGWEGWYGYPRISREEHQEQTERFILAHPDLFRDGDAFSSCPECENGGPGDPRQSGDVEGHRRFLIAEYQMMERSFDEIGKNVRTHLFSMNGDVARLVMDPPTTKALGGRVTIDHYVASPEALAEDVREIAHASGGRVILGEFGAPIPDIHGPLTEEEQARWLHEALSRLSGIQALEGLNYWVSAGGSTELWNAEHVPRAAASVLEKYYQPGRAYGFVTDELGRPIPGAQVSHGERSTETDENGHFELTFPNDRILHLKVSAPGYAEYQEALPAGLQERRVTLVKSEKDWKFKGLQYLQGK